MTRIVNRDTPKRKLPRLKMIFTEIYCPYRVFSIGRNTYFLYLIEVLVVLYKVSKRALPEDQQMAGGH